MVRAGAEDRDADFDRGHLSASSIFTRGRVGGRPSVMSPDRLAAAKASRAQGQSIAAVARTLGVSPATIRRHAIVD